MSNVTHPADAGFRVIVALMRAREIHRRVASLLPSYPPSLKEAHDAEWRALTQAWGGMWDVFCSEGVGGDATADTSTCVPCGEDVAMSGAAAKLSQDATLTHSFAPPPDAPAA